MPTAVRPSATPAGTDGFLSRLLETEALLAERLAAVEAECARIREAARRERTATDAEEQRDVAAARLAVEREYAERRLAVLAEIEGEKVRRVEALRALPMVEIDRLAADLIERMLRRAGGTVA